MAAVGELEQEYGDRMDFAIISAEETARSSADIEAFGFTELKHGLVIFAADGEPVVKMPGHQFGRTEIEAAMGPVLAAE